MKTLEQVVLEQINDIKQMLTRLEGKPQSQKQKEETYKVLQGMQNKLDKLI